MNRPPQNRSHSPRPRSRRQKYSEKKIIILILCISFLVAFFIHRQQSNANDVIDVLAPYNQTEGETTELAMLIVPSYTLQDTGYLKLVNRILYVTRPTGRAYLVDAFPTVPVRATDITMHQTALNAIAALFREGRHIADFFITSGYRGFYLQEYLYENAVDRMYVLPPGHSEHQLGLAADILAPGISMGQMSGTPEAIWLAENAWRHGLILRYPYGTTHITGVAYEPWHFRYVGRVHAWFMTQNNMVMEEYLDFLAETGGFSTLFDGAQYHIMYLTPANGQIYVPRDLPFTVSFSNRGGYVITAREG